MSTVHPLTEIVARLRRCGGGPADGELLARFAARRDEDAFAELVERHGGLVLGVARRHLGDRTAAEDVVQATFLALARSASRLGRPASLVNWLYTVALRQTRTARRHAARRAARMSRLMPPTPPADTLAEVSGRELVGIIDDELARLPATYRLPLLLCAIEGLSREEAARRLGWPVGSVKGRLERGRELLRRRLAARGLTVPAVLAGGLLATPAEALPPNVVKAIAAAAIAVTPVAGGTLRALAILTIVAGISLGGVFMAGTGDTPAQPKPQAAAAPRPVEPDDPLPAGASRRFGSARYRHVTRIQDLAVSADATVAVANSRTLIHGGVRAYDLATGRVLQTFHDSDKVGDDVRGVALSPDGKMVAIAMAFPPPSTIFLRDVATGREMARMPLAAGSTVLQFAPDGKQLLVSDKEGLCLIGLAAGEVVRSFAVGGSVFTAALSPDGKQLAVGGHDNAWFARRWEVDTGRELDPLPIGNNGIRSIAYSADRATIAVGGEARRGSVVLIDATTNNVRRAIPFPDGSLVRSVAISPDGKTVAASAGTSTRLFDTSTGQERVKIDRHAIGLKFSPDGGMLIGAVGGAIYRWDAASGKSLIPAGGDSPVAQIAVAADGKRVVSLGEDGDGHVWDARTGEHRRRLDMSRFQGFAISPDGRFVVWPVADETIRFQSSDEPNSIYTGSRLRMFDFEAGTFVERFGGFKASPADLAFTDGGNTLVTADRWRHDAGVHVWDVASGNVVRSFAADWKPVSRVVRSRVSPDGKLLAVLYQGQARGLLVDSEVKLWDIATGKEVVGAPRPPWFDPEVMTYAPNGKTMAIAVPPFATTIQFLDPATGRVRGEFRGPLDLVTALAVGADGRLFTGFRDGTILAWDSRVVNVPADRP